MTHNLSPVNVILLLYTKQQCIYHGIYTLCMYNYLYHVEAVRKAVSLLDANVQTVCIMSSQLEKPYHYETRSVE